MKKTFIKKKKIKEFSKSLVFGFFFGLILGTVFSFIDNLIFLIAEETMTNFLERNLHNRSVIGIVESSFSAAVAFLIASYIEERIVSKKYNIIKHPFIDFCGILLGGLIVILLYYFIIFLQKKFKVNFLRIQE